MPDNAQANSNSDIEFANLLEGMGKVFIASAQRMRSLISDNCKYKQVNENQHRKLTEMQAQLTSLQSSRTTNISIAHADNVAMGDNVQTKTTAPRRKKRHKSHKKS